MRNCGARWPTKIVQAVEATLKEKLDMKKHVKLIDNALKKVVLN